ncbi:cupin domain-containing protein [Rhodobacteraceae bacterium CCMM004]|nr:cupin domain-containing protein [Rhodobacteraceae bacterium CCMM004]
MPASPSSSSGRPRAIPTPSGCCSRWPTAAAPRGGPRPRTARSTPPPPRWWTASTISWKPPEPAPAMSDPGPIVIRANDPDVPEWTDADHGGIRYRAVVGGDGDGAEAGLYQVVTVIEPGTRQSPHSHDVDEAVCILEGRAQLHAAGRTIDLSEGDAVVLRSGLVHAWLAPAGPVRFLSSFAGSGPPRHQLAEAP